MRHVKDLFSLLIPRKPFLNVFLGFLKHFLPFLKPKRCWKKDFLPGKMDLKVLEEDLLRLQVVKSPLKRFGINLFLNGENLVM